MSCSWAWRSRSLNISQLYWAPLFSRAFFHGILSSMFLRRLKSVLLKTTVLSLLWTLLAALRILNCTVSWSLQPRLPLNFTFPISPYLLMRMLSSTVPLLVGSFVNLRKNYHQRIPGTSWIAYTLLCCPSNRHCGGSCPPWRSWLSNILSVHRGHHLLSLPVTDHTLGPRTPQCHSVLGLNALIYGNRPFLLS